MKQRNPNNHPISERNEKRTRVQIERYYGVAALLATWETQPAEVQERNHDYIIALRAKVRNVRNYLLNRNDPTINV